MVDVEEDNKTSDSVEEEKPKENGKAENGDKAEEERNGGECHVTVRLVLINVETCHLEWLLIGPDKDGSANKSIEKTCYLE